MSLIRRAYVSPSVNTRWNLWQDFDELLNGYTSEMDSGPMKAFTPQAEIKESEKGYLFSFDVPGVKEEDIKIEFSDSILKIFGERKSAIENESNGHFQTEKTYGRFERLFRLPESVNDSEVEAHYKDGVLQVFLPKTPAKTAKKIEIKKSESSLLQKLLAKDEEKH